MGIYGLEFIPREVMFERRQPSIEANMVVPSRGLKGFRKNGQSHGRNNKGNGYWVCDSMVSDSVYSYGSSYGIGVPQIGAKIILIISSAPIIAYE